MNDLGNTQSFAAYQDRKLSVSDILKEVHAALEAKGYKPVNQIVGYIMSGDPTYITSYNGARLLISKVERDELLEELLQTYINVNIKGKKDRP